MRFKSTATGGIQVFAVSGNQTVSFGITANDVARTGLMGFAIDRTNLDLSTKAKNRTLPMLNSKVFKSEAGKKMKLSDKSTWKHPLQSFVWDDFGAQPDTQYEYTFTPLQGPVGKLTAMPGRMVSIKVHTEPLFSKATHDVFFNRGVASSQAYTEKFGNSRPDQLTPQKRAEACA